MSILRMAAMGIMSAGGSVTLSLAISPSSVSGTAEDFGGPATAISDLATATESGGTGPYTYAWTFVSGDAMTIGAPTSNATTFSKTNDVAGNPVFNAVFKCTVTDNNSNTAEDTVDVQLRFIDLS